MASGAAHPPPLLSSPRGSDVLSRYKQAKLAAGRPSGSSAARAHRQCQTFCHKVCFHWGQLNKPLGPKRIHVHTHSSVLVHKVYLNLLCLTYFFPLRNSVSLVFVLSVFALSLCPAVSGFTPSWGRVTAGPAQHTLHTMFITFFKALQSNVTNLVTSKKKHWATNNRFYIFKLGNLGFRGEGISVRQHVNNMLTFTEKDLDVKFTNIHYSFAQRKSFLS